MSQRPADSRSDAPSVHHPRFAAYYERQSQGSSERRFFEPLRRELLEQAHGRVLEIGAGNGLNFSFYAPEQVTEVEAIEPDSTMLSYARQRLSQARVPLSLTQASAESLPFADETFDCVVATLVFCSVSDPACAFQELRRVLKPGGTLLLLEHVRAQSRFIAFLQDLLVPVTTRVIGNCHWNRATGQTVRASGFQILHEHLQSGWFLPILSLQATKA